jgi:hypothetical protein
MGLARKGGGEAEWRGCPWRQSPRGGKVNVVHEKTVFGTALQILNCWAK